MAEMRKRKQYQISSYKVSDFDKLGSMKSFKDSIPISLAENQVTELIQSVKERKYIVDNFNFIRELIFLNVTNVKTDEQEATLTRLTKEGITINGTTYRRFVRSTSMARTSKIAFIDETIIGELEMLISLGQFNKFEDVIISKFESYMGLAFSTTRFVDAVPENVCIVDDGIFDVIINDKVKGIRDGELIEGYYDVNVNLFDGMGLHSPSYGKKVAKALGLKEEVPVAYQIRLLPGFKGMSYEIDFRQFYKEKGITHITDKWNRDWAVDDLDCIWSTSMFKLHSYFDSWKEYIDLRESQYKPLGQDMIGISSYSDTEVNPFEKTRMTYQYLQVLSLTRDEIVELAEYTKDTLERVYKGDIGATLTYLNLIAKQDSVDDLEDEEAEDEMLKMNMIANKVATAISCNNKMINDPYVSQFIMRQLKKSIDDAKLGRIWVDGRYSYIAQDPIMMLEMVAGLEPKGSLNKDEFYSSGEIGLRAFFRSPLTHSSEVHRANLIHNELTDKWLSRYKNIIVLNGKDITAQKISGSDFDGDKYFITKNPLIVDRVMTQFKVIDEEFNVTYKENLPVVDIDEQRNRDLVKKEKRTIENLIKFDKRSLDNLIGKITNISTFVTTYAMTHNKLANKDYELVYLRLLQGQEIDYSKHGVRTLQIPEKYAVTEMYKPYFLQKYKYGRDDFFQNFVNTAPMNILCKNIEKWEKEIFTWDDWTKREIDTTDILMDKDVLNRDKEETKRVMAELEKVYADYRTDFKELKLMVSNLRSKNSEATKKVIKDAYGQFYDKYYYLANQITDDEGLLSSVAVYLTYIKYKTDKQTKSYQFPWVCSWQGLMRRLSSTQSSYKNVPVPIILDSYVKYMIKNEETFEYLGKHYRLENIKAEVNADQFISEEYARINEREFKKRVKDFELDLVLVGFRDKSVEEVEQGILKKKLKLGISDFKGKNYATIEGQDGYLASIKATNTKHLLDDGYIDLTDFNGSKVKVKIVEKNKNSMTIQLKLVS